MNTINTLIAVVVTALLSGCGGGGSNVSPAEAARMLLDQIGECFAVAAGSASPDKFNAAAADIASVPVADICLAWPAGTSINCRATYAALARPYSDGGQCKVTP